MSPDLLDRLGEMNTYGPTDVPPLTPEREAEIMHAARTDLAGPLRRSWLVAAAVGLVLGVGSMAIWFSPGENIPPGGGQSEESTDSGPATVEDDTEEGPTTISGGEVDLFLKIDPIDIQCSSELNGTSLACANLIDGTPAYWNDNSLRGAGAVIAVTFAEPVRLEQVQFNNLEDSVAFRRNYRIRIVEIITDDLPGLPFLGKLPNDNDRVHAVTTPTLGTTQVIIRIVLTWPSEAIDGRAFEELALDEITFWGRITGSTSERSDDSPPTTLAPKEIPGPPLLAHGPIPSEPPDYDPALIEVIVLDSPLGLATAETSLGTCWGIVNAEAGAPALLDPRCPGDPLTEELEWLITANVRTADGDHLVIAGLAQDAVSVLYKTESGNLVSKDTDEGLFLIRLDENSGNQTGVLMLVNWIGEAFANYQIYASYNVDG